MGIYENPLSFGQEDQEDNPDVGFDAVQYAAERQKERLKKQAEEKAEKEASEAKKKAEKEARIAKKYANKATKQLEKKTDKLSDATDQAKEKIAETKEAVDEISHHLRDAVTAIEQGNGDSPAPVEMNFTEGSEYIAELKEGEEAIFDLSQSADSVEKTVELADEVVAKAEALARARAALDEVVSDDMGVENNTLVESQDVFGVTGPEQDVRERLKHAWEPSEQLITMDTNQSESVENAVSGDELPAPLTSYVPETREYGWAGSAVSEQSMPLESPTTERRDAPASQAVAAGYFAGKAQNFRQELRNTDSRLQTQIRELQSEISTSQVYPMPTLDIDAPEMITRTDRPSSVKTEQSTPLPSVEQGAGNYDAVPQWIKQLELAVKRGSVVELKKWQKDVLKSQHPDLLKRYERLDNGVKHDIKRQSIEYSPSGFAPPTPKFSTGQAEPGDLPRFIPQMPAYMQDTPVKTPPATPSVSQTPLSAYDYALNSRSEGSVFSNTYLSIVTIGGVLFGAVLISVFGL